MHDYRDPESPIPANEPSGSPPTIARRAATSSLLYIDNATKAGAPSYDPAAAFFHKHIKAN